MESRWRGAWQSEDDVQMTEKKALRAATRGWRPAGGPFSERRWPIKAARPPRPRPTVGAIASVKE